MELLKAELAESKKRKLVDVERPGPKKFVKRGEIEKKKKEVYLKEQKLLEERRKKKEEERLKQLLEEIPKKDQKEQQVPVPILPKKEVIRRLRVRSEPITLFGESDLDRAERLRKLELKEPMEYLEGSSNEYAETAKDIQIEEEDFEAEELDYLQKKRNEDEDPDFKVDDKEPTCDEEKIWFFFRKLLREWQLELDSRPATEKRTAEGRSQTVTYAQCRRYIKPFFKLCRRRVAGAVPDSILTAVMGIVESLKKRDYVKANDFYYRMAIGNAPWPMGVTMVGIHERSAREKIFSNQIAHVLNDETQRKYISSIKRLMTFCQRKYTALPSKCVM